MDLNNKGTSKYIDRQLILKRNLLLLILLHNKTEETNLSLHGFEKAHFAVRYLHTYSSFFGYPRSSADDRTYAVSILNPVYV